jgi:hypothetical protein
MKIFFFIKLYYFAFFLKKIKTVLNLKNKIKLGAIGSHCLSAGRLGIGLRFSC